MSEITKHDTAESIGTKVGTAIAKGSKATKKGVIFSVAFTGLHSKRLGKSFWKGMKVAGKVTNQVARDAGKAIAEEYNKQDSK